MTATAKTAKRPGRPRTTAQIPHASAAHAEIARRVQDGSLRTSYNGCAVLALERYFAALRDGRERARKLFSQDELEFILGVLGEEHRDAAALADLPEEVEGAALKLRANSSMRRVAQALRDAGMVVVLALADAAEEYRRHPRRYGSLLACMERLDQEA